MAVLGHRTELRGPVAGLGAQGSSQGPSVVTLPRPSRLSLA